MPYFTWGRGQLADRAPHFGGPRHFNSRYFRENNSGFTSCVAIREQDGNAAAGARNAPAWQGTAQVNGSRGVCQRLNRKHESRGRLETRFPGTVGIILPPPLSQRGLRGPDPIGNSPSCFPDHKIRIIPALLKRFL